MNIIPIIKSLLQSNCEKEVIKIKVENINDKNKITVFFIDNTFIVDNNPNLKPFLINKLKQALKVESLNFEIDFLTNQINTIN